MNEHDWDSRPTWNSPPSPVRKYGTRVPVSVETLIATGGITEDQARAMGWTPPPPVSRLKHLRWDLEDWWSAHRPHVHLGPCEDHDE